MEQETNGFRPARLSWVLAFGTGAMVVAMLFLLWLRADLRHVEQIDTPQPLMPVEMEYAAGATTGGGVLRIEGFVRQKGLEPSVFDCTVALVYEDGTARALPTRMLYSGQYHIFPVRQIASSGVLAIADLADLPAGTPEIVFLCRHDGMVANVYTNVMAEVEKTA